MNQPEKLDGYITVKSPAGNLKLSGELAALKWGVDAIDSGRREEIIREAQNELLEVLEREVELMPSYDLPNVRGRFLSKLSVTSILNQHKK